MTRPGIHPAGAPAPPRPAPGTGPPPAPHPPDRGQRLPEIPGPVDTAAWLWRRLRRMSTALLLLFAQAVASAIGTIVPQEPLIPTTVAEWRAGEAGPGPAVATAFDRLGFFDVYGSWWFAALTVALFVSLTGCLLPRWRAFARAARRPPDAGRNLDRLSNRAVIETGLDTTAALDAADRVLRRRRYRRRRIDAAATDSGDTRIAAERGHAREGGSLIFHSAFYLLLAGAVIGQAYGFTGQINLPEGSGFADTRIAYDLAEPGRYFGLDDHRGFLVTLDDFTVDYHDNNVAADYVSTVTISEGGEPAATEEVRVNHPITYAGMKLYQARFGMAPRVVVRSGDTVLYDERVMMTDAGGFAWTGVAKVSVGDPGGEDPAPQIALDLVFLPDAAMDGGVPYSRSPRADNPVLIGELYVGDDLGLERPVPASQFNRDGGTRFDPPAVLREGNSMELADGNLTVEFPELSHWSGFQVSHAPGRGLLLVAAVLLLAGLVPSLYSYRRRVWVEAQPAGDRTRVVVSGVALQRKPLFADEFAGLVGSLRGSLAAGDEPTQPPEASRNDD